MLSVLGVCSDFPITWLKVSNQWEPACELTEEDVSMGVLDGLQEVVKEKDLGLSVCLLTMAG